MKISYAGLLERKCETFKDESDYELRVLISVGFPWHLSHMFLLTNQAVKAQY